MGIDGLSGLSGLSSQVIIPGTPVTSTCGTGGCITASAYSFSTGTFTVAWTNPTNITNCDTINVAACTIGTPPDFSQYLIATNFNLTSIPDNARIDGITVTWNLSATGAGWTDASCVLFKGASLAPTIISNDLGVGTNTFVANTYTNYVYGSSTNNWGLTGNNNLGSALKAVCDFGVGLAVTRPATATGKVCDIACCNMQVNYSY